MLCNHMFYRSADMRIDLRQNRSMVCGVCSGTHGSYVIYWQEFIPLICQGKVERNFFDDR